ncbi:MAG: helix-turn-helix domain-containing protein [Candidatus Thorarchaeota archaeon]
MFMVSSAQLLDILGNETRRMILELLAEKPRYTTEIASLLSIGQKAINDHLRILSDSGVIEPYVQKQSRGSPRKYFKVNEKFRLEFTLTPGYFEVYILDFDVDTKSIIERFPEFQKLQRQVEQIENIRRIGKYGQICRDLGNELIRLQKAKMYVESLLAKVRMKCMKVIDSMGLNPEEKRILFEVVTAEGDITVEEISVKCKIPEQETIRVLNELKQKGVLRL